MMQNGVFSDRKCRAF